MMLARAILFFLLMPLLVMAQELRPPDQMPKIKEAPPGGDFMLHSSNGPFSLQEQRGRVVLLYFGYTKCPDICPTSLASLAVALNQLEKEELSKVQGVFITVDPERDTLELLDDYVEYFHPSLVAVTGSKDEIAAAARFYGAKYYEVELEGSAFGYAVNHSAAIYLVTPEGELRFIFPHGTPSYVILEAIRYVLAGN